jgi:hypothetical protein
MRRSWSRAKFENGDCAQHSIIGSKPPTDGCVLKNAQQILPEHNNLLAWQADQLVVYLDHHQIMQCHFDPGFNPSTITTNNNSIYTQLPGQRQQPITTTTTTTIKAAADIPKDNDDGAAITIDNDSSSSSSKPKNRKTVAFETWQGLCNQLAALGNSMLLVYQTPHELILPAAFTRLECRNFYEELWQPFALADLIDIATLLDFAERRQLRLLSGRPNNWLIRWAHFPLQQASTERQTLLEWLDSEELRNYRVVYLGNTLQCCGDQLTDEECEFMQDWFRTGVRPAAAIEQCAHDIFSTTLCGVGTVAPSAAAADNELYLISWHARLEADYFIYRKTGDTARIIADMVADAEAALADRRNLKVVVLHICTGLVGEELKTLVAYVRQHVPSNWRVWTKSTEETPALLPMNFEQRAMVDWWLTRQYASRLYACTKSSFSMTLAMVMPAENVCFVDDNYSHCTPTSWKSLGFTGRIGGGGSGSSNANQPTTVNKVAVDAAKAAQVAAAETSM